MQPRDVVRVRLDAEPGSLTTRRWLRKTQAELDHLLPAGGPRALLTEELSDESGEPIDVFEHFGWNPNGLQTLLFNFQGLLFSAQCIGTSLGPEKLERPWPGFEEVCIPVADGVETFGWLGLARDGERVNEADCIVILPGLLGNNGVKRMHDLARALVSHGFHVLAYEVRGHGLSDLRRPDVYYNFGVLETRDLMVVSDWLEDKPFVRRTGMIGYCWGANLALLAAWYENLPPGDAAISPRLAEHLPPLSRRGRYRAGILAFSPTLAFEEILVDLQRPMFVLSEPAFASLQETVATRMKAKNYPEISGDLQKLIDFEFARSVLNYPGAVEDGVRFLRLLPYQGEPSGRRMAEVRVPVLLVYGANDPLAPAQQVADFVAGEENPCFSALVLPDGGHIGFAAYAREYYFSLIFNFFDPAHGAAAMSAASSDETRTVQRRSDTHAH